MEPTIIVKQESPKKVLVSNHLLNISSSAMNNKKLHVCQVCSKAFSRKFVLNRHMKFCLGEKPLSCNICKKSFVQKCDLQRHLTVHSKIPSQFKCDQCSEIFSRKYNLLKHMKIHSKPTIKYNCDQCSEVFMRKLDLLKHMKIHSKPAIIHNCDQCSEVFMRKLDLLKHRKIHSRPTIKHKCIQCSKCFSRKYDLLKHRKIHSKPSIQHNCDQCSEVFLRKLDLLKHKKIHKVPKQYKCLSCDEVFNRRSDLICHIDSSHPHTGAPKEKNAPTKDELYEKVKHFQRINALNVFTTTTIVPTENNDKDFHVFFDSIRSDVLNELNYQLEEKTSFKWHAIAHVRVTRTTQDGDVETATPFFRSNNSLEGIKENIPRHIEDAFNKIHNSFEKFTHLGSGWTLDEILKLELYSAKYRIC